MKLAEDWSDHVCRVVPFDDEHGTHRAFITDLFRRAQAEARAVAMRDLKATLGVTLEDLCSSR